MGQSIEQDQADGQLPPEELRTDSGQTKPYVTRLRELSQDALIEHATEFASLAGKDVDWLQTQMLVAEFIDRWTAGKTAEKTDLSLSQLSRQSESRCRRWHPEGIEDWSVNDWLCAMGGEAGEALNAGKKHRRILGKMQQHGNVPKSLEDATDKIMEELADTVIYAQLCAARLNRKLQVAIVAKFNSISVREGFPERLALE
jgi:NTP pyrophosphatase (non-canonical NTP hydrolase)